MKIPGEYDAIRPFEPQELPEVFDRLLADQQFQAVLAYLYPQVPVEAIAQKMHACHSCLDFQKAFCYDFLKNLMAKASKGFDMDVSHIDVSRRYTFVSNHRDIVLDSALLDVLLIDNGFDTTCEIAIGDNLLSLPWVKDLARVNKSFIVERSLPPRQMFMASKRLSDYMHFVINEKNDNIWIAQREGRAKDSNDRTQQAILKMMTMGGTGTPVDRLKQLHIVPLAISYEYDPCDYLKAREFQLKRDIEGWKKSKEDDVLSMRTGILGYKGQVHYHCAPCIDDYLDQLSPDIPKTEIYEVIASHIDEEIHRNYRLYPCNYLAIDLLSGESSFSMHYNEAYKTQFLQYLDTQLAKINDVPNKDEAFLRECILTMYANPAINYLSSR